MILHISTKQESASNLSFLLHKHPERLQSVEIPSGKAYIFYPVFKENHCEVCLLLDLNSVALVRNSQQNNTDFKLDQYVNDRPYVASSYMSVAIAKAFSSALNGNCNLKPELVDEKFQFNVHIPVVPAIRGGELLIKKLFEPLGYQLEIKRHQLDDKNTAWGASKFFDLKISNYCTLKSLLSHLYILIPCLDNHKHYWVSHSEVDKLLDKGIEWLPEHPEKEQITTRYLKDIKSLSKYALNHLIDTQESGIEETHTIQKKESLHQIRLKTVAEELVASGAKSVIDLGCGEGKLIKLLMRHKQFLKITGMDISFRTLEIARDRLFIDEMSGLQKERIQLIHGSLNYKDERLNKFDAAALVEVIEHMEPDRLPSFEKSVFGYSQPDLVIVTTPNKEYNQLFENLNNNAFRHSDHRFEWTRAEFQEWTSYIERMYNYQVIIKPLGEEDNKYGPPSQMAVFTKNQTIDQL